MPFGLFLFPVDKAGGAGGGGGDKARFVFVLFSDCALITAGWRASAVRRGERGGLVGKGGQCM